MPTTTTPTHTIEAGNAVALYLVVSENADVGLYLESNSLPGLQQEGRCGHRGDSRIAEACPRVDTRIPGTIACVIETSS